MTRKLIAGTGWKMNIGGDATIVDAWLASEFEHEGASAENVRAIDSVSNKYAKRSDA